MTGKYLTLLTCALISSGIMTPTTARISSQERAIKRPDLSGRWQLNRKVSDDAERKLESMRSSQGASGHGPGRHGGFGGIFGGGRADHAQLEEVVLNAPTRLVVTQDDRNVVMTDSDGRVRTLPTNNRKVKVGGRDVQTRWENNRLVSEITVGRAKVIETYERSPSAPQLIVATKLDMRGHEVSIRRVYDAVAE